MRNYKLPMADSLNYVMDQTEAFQVAAFYELTSALRDPGGDGPRKKILVEDDHPTHWVTFARHWGYLDESQNGLYVCFVPKTMASTIEQALHFSQRF